MKKVLIAAVALLGLLLGGVAFQLISSKSGGRISLTKPAPPLARPQDSHESLPSFLDKMLSGELPKLTPAQLAAFVDKRNHNAASLVAAWQLGGDRAWLDEAARRFPNNPRVALAKLADAEGNSTGETQEWIACLQRDAPDNALGWCYAALAAAKDGRLEAAEEALADAAQRGHLNSYGKESAQEMAEAFRSAGFNGLEADILGRSLVPVPESALFLGLIKQITSSGQSDSNVLANLLAVSGMMRSEPQYFPMILQLVDASVQKKALNGMDVSDTIPGSDALVAERLAALDTEITAVREAIKLATPLLPTLTPSELKQYYRRSDVEGELKALQWVIQLKKAQ
jgi:hypothetical protein